MIITFDITKVTILVGRGADKVLLHTTEDSSFPNISEDLLSIEFQTASNNGLNYVTKVLGIDDELIEVIKLPI